MHIALIIHISSAVLTLAVALYSHFHKSLLIERSLDLATLTSLISGAWLIKDGVLNIGDCVKLGLYLTIVMYSKYLLYQTNKRTEYDQNRRSN